MKCAALLILMGVLFFAGCEDTVKKSEPVQQDNVRWKNLEQQQELLDSLPRAYEMDIE